MATLGVFVSEIDTSPRFTEGTRGIISDELNVFQKIVCCLVVEDMRTELRSVGQQFFYRLRFGAQAVSR